jgi:ATP-binding cassette subfamily B protein
MSQKATRVSTWLLRELWSVRAAQGMAVVAVILHGSLSVVDPLLLKWILDQGLEALSARTAGIAITAFIVLYTLRVGAQYLGSIAALRMQQQLSRQIPLRLYRKLTAADELYRRHAVGDLTTRLERDVEQFTAVCTELAPNLARTVIVTVSAVIVMFSLNWRLGASVLPFIGLYLVLRGRLRRSLERLSDRVRQAAGSRTSFLTESLIGMSDVQLLGAEDRFYRSFEAKTSDALRAVWRQRATEVHYSMAGLGIFTVAMVSTLALGAAEIQAGRFTVGGYVAFYTLLSRLFDPLAAAAELYARITKIGAGIRRIIELEDDEPRVSEPAAVVIAPTAAPAAAPSAGATFSGATLPAAAVVPIGTTPQAVHRVEIRNLTFHYPDRPVLLRGIDLVLRRGEHVALLGKSGGGKSTTARLIARSSDPTDGRVLLDGVDVRSIALRELRSAVCVVPQDFHLFQGSLLYNATLGVGEVVTTRLDHVAAIAGFDVVVRKFENGWLHELGPGGSGLSQGEKQRLVLLRGLLRDSPVVILDETTAALDPATEAGVLSRLRAYCRDTCLLIITHRLSAALAADRIIVIRDGRIVRECRPADVAGHPDVERLLWAEADERDDSLRLQPTSMGER